MYANSVKALMPPRRNSSVSRVAVNEMKIASQDSASGAHVQRARIKSKGVVLVKAMEVASRETVIRVFLRWIGFAKKPPRMEHRRST